MFTPNTVTPLELWSALPTPFHSSGEIDEPGLRLNIERCISVGLNGVYCNGLMGESWSLTVDERQRVLEVVIEACAGRLDVSPVTSTDDLAETIALTEHAQEAGATYAVLVPPRSITVDADLLAFLNAVIDRVDIPYVIFNPGTPDGLGCALSTSTFAALCTNPRVRILKTTANPDLNLAMRQIARGTHVQVSDPLEEHFFDNVLEHGQQLLYCDPEGYLYQTEKWKPIRAYADLIAQGEFEDARRIFDSLDPLRKLYRKWIIGPLEVGVMPNAALKRWCEFVGMAGGPVRPPLVELTNSAAAEFDQELRKVFSAVQPVAN
ncbi:dihydrodipicolinate synthase family protein [Rhodococcus qingshengii]|uniref:dihydrodipicolinate synthase family protein n=1 Tax=Rhodococcus qingshengii TaxID=334542 RepID=UPI0001A217F5|nr:dihydrodipicolinate synthetase family [Rhodococcus erythropolis SK121]